MPYIYRRLVEPGSSAVAAATFVRGNSAGLGHNSINFFHFDNTILVRRCEGLALDGGAGFGESGVYPFLPNLRVSDSRTAAISASECHPVAVQWEFPARLGGS
jgi:hypothetical protein